MSNNNVLLSIIIPAYNVAATIKECVMSVVCQQCKEIEIIIVDDGSTDNTLEVCNNLAKNYSIIKVYQQMNLGVSAARNYGINMASGKWLSFLDGDDAIQKDALKIIDYDIESDAIIFNYRTEKVFQQQEIKNQEVDTELLMGSILNYPKYRKQLSSLKAIDPISNWTCWGKLFRRKIIIDNKIIFPIGITHGEDLVFCYRYYQYANRVLCSSIVFYYYYINPDSVTHKFNPNRIKNTEKILKEIKIINSKSAHYEDYVAFVIHRLIACCKLYFANPENRQSKSQKAKNLASLCNEVEYREALKKCDMFHLSIGYLTRIKNIILVLLLKMHCYKAAIFYLCIS